MRKTKSLEKKENQRKIKKKKKGIAKDKECIIRNTETKPHFSMSKIILKDFPVAQMLKNLPAMQKTQV